MLFVVAVLAKIAAVTMDATMAINSIALQLLNHCFAFHQR